ncbi:hypothetical protein IFT36_02125 [Frigoribacterium sp. CFBP 13605]|uniref:hypothetical protein n=1 Tax=Frigoribacterium sp. CFBP 13605 TaxID=2774034 RepID=UPI001906EC75|nr:hypothetical protein [Frigoribacterium sp. CFBP 13605]MBD8139342.1 hypothetical protein [Frigoribacterium sp. CFBP 13605]
MTIAHAYDEVRQVGPHPLSDDPGVEHVPADQDARGVPRRSQVGVGPSDVGTAGAEEARDGIGDGARPADDDGRRDDRPGVAAQRGSQALDGGFDRGAIQAEVGDEGGQAPRAVPRGEGRDHPLVEPADRTQDERGAVDADLEGRRIAPDDGDAGIEDEGHRPIMSWGRGG